MVKLNKAVLHGGVHMDFSEIIRAYFQGLKDSLRGDGATENEVLSLFDDCDEFPELYDEGLIDISKMVLEDVTEELNKRDKKEKNDRAQTRKRFSVVWGEGYAWMRQFYSLAFDSCMSLHKLTEKSPNIVEALNYYEATRLITMRAIMVYNEVLCLMENGFPDGAFAHYRTLYELWAVAEFLAHDEDKESVSKTYLESASKISNNEAGHYKWAKTSKRFEGSENVTIYAIVKQAHETCTLKQGGRSNSQLMRDYTFPNSLIHPSAIGLEVISSSMPDAKTVGMANPAISSSIKLFEICSLYLYFFANVEAESNEDIMVAENAFICNQLLSAMLWDKIHPIFNRIEHDEDE